MIIAVCLTIDQVTVGLALPSYEAHATILPPSYTAQPVAIQTVPLTAIVLDFNQRLVDYDTNRLRSIIAALRSGTPLPPLSVNANPGGTYNLVNGYHRFLACALIGFNSIPIDQAALAMPPPIVGAKYIPRHLRNK